MKAKFILLFYTLIHLKNIQLFYQLWYRLKSKSLIRKRYQFSCAAIKSLQWKDGIYNLESYKEFSNFSFLNISHSFSGKIDWNYDEYGKLWTYNLNYFDFLNQEDMSTEIGISLINDFIKNDKILKDGKEPYPISLRGINWVKFLSKNEIKDPTLNKALYNHYRILIKNLEYHLLANHLLENAFSLLFGAYYFQDEKLYAKSKKLLISELDEQILIDGAHYELSPMYHQILYYRLLDCINLVKLNPLWKKDDLISFLNGKALLMNSWLQNITYESGNIPMVNDSTFNIAPNSKKIFSYAKQLGINSQNIPLSDSGYRKIKLNSYELLIDIGNVGPSYQPGHAHSDTFNFELIKNGNPIFVDTGVSTYKKDEIRQKERSTASHNTVMLGGIDQTEVWGGFRVARRAKVFDIQAGLNFLSAKHSGYIKNGYVHSRLYEWSENKITIKDSLSKSSMNNAKAFFHFHSSINLPKIENNTVLIGSLGINLNFEKAYEIFIDEYKLSMGFNKTMLAYKIVVTFDHYLETNINFK